MSAFSNTLKNGAIVSLSKHSELVIIEKSNDFNQYLPFYVLVNQ